jgi:hypothetical protein
MSASGSGFGTQDGKSPSQVPAGTTVWNPSTGQSGNADGYGGVNVYKK